MKLAKTMACSAAALGFAIGSAFAGEGQSGMNDSWSPNESTVQEPMVQEPMAQEESFILLDPVDVAYYNVYEVDENGDGVIDGYLFIEESDALG